MMRRCLMLLGVLAVLSDRALAQIGPDAQNAIGTVRPEAIEADLNFLADDLLKGRQTGTEGFDMASLYVKTQFTAMGLQPGVDGKTYVQQVPLKKGVVDEKKSGMRFIVGGKSEELRYDEDFVLNTNLVDPSSEVTAPLVYVGFGVYAPEMGYDDYKNTDVRNKIVVYFDQAPSSFPSNERAYFSSGNVKYAEAVKRGAVGVVYVEMPDNSRSSWEAIVRNRKQGAFRWIDEGGNLPNTFPQLKGIAFFNATHAEKLFAHSGRAFASIIADAKADKPTAFPLGMDAQLKVETTTTAIASSNLIGLIPGSDPVLKNEYVVYVAHVDHFGVGVPVKGDSIYNGAHDNAAGVAIVLNVARAFKRLPTPPRRSILIAIVTAEEYGLLGSDYFATNPTVNRSNMVANLTLDMPFFFHPVLDIVPYGAQHSSLSIQVEEAARYLNLAIGPDPFPDQVLFIRSDHFSFIKKGIPSLFIKSGFKTTDADTTDRSVTDVAWRRTTYHTPQDDSAQAFDFGGAATHVKLNFLVGYLIANAPSRPSWHRGDFFGGKFGKTDGLAK